ncbi:hypothetical protein B0H13DRAFT_2129163 [Mycena leptocephala]|nr:hypothetical protein B0H13DRAFT_2129163 [Mycena leptocephala]
MDPSSTNSASTSELRRRIAALEIDLQTAEAAREEAESNLVNHRKNAEHARHVRCSNLASYGHSDEIIFVQPEDLDQGLICRLSKGLGPFLQRPRLHQWMSGGKIHREAGEQQSSRFELFFDLLFLWADVRDVANQYANDDVTHERAILTEEGLTSMRWTLGFFVVAKLSRVVLSLVYALFLPLSRKPLFVSTLNAITMEILGKKYEKRRQQHYRQNSCPGTDEGRPFAADPTRTVNSSVTAVNEEVAPFGAIKACQRTAAQQEYRFPGEMVVSVFFTSSGLVGLNMESGRAILGLMIAFNLNWIYFGSQACKHFIHAIRRHWFSGFLFTTLHLPLCMSLLLASSAINRLVTSATLESELGGGLKWFFGAGLGASVWTMATIGVLHKNLDDAEGLTERTTTRRTISRRFVLGIRYLAGLVMILVPIADDLNSIQFLAIYVGITAFLIIEEIIARIEKREQDLDVTTGSGSEGEVIA